MISLHVNWIALGSMPANKNVLALSDSDGYGSGPCWIGSIQNKLYPDPAIKSRTDPTEVRDQEPPMKSALQKAYLQCIVMAQIYFIHRYL
jgi:hypothetical protein